MIADIYNIGCSDVIIVVTDTCAQMKKAWGYVMDEFPWISAIPCIPHVTSLLLKDIAKIPAVAEVLQDESTVVGWFSNHQKPLAILRDKTKQLLGKSLGLVKAGETRFGTHTLVGERLLELQTPIQQSIYDPDYVKEGYKGQGCPRFGGAHQLRETYALKQRWHGEEASDG